MEIGLFAQSHGLPRREGRDFVLSSLPLEELDIQGVAQLAEAQGFHTIWTGDHVVMDRAPDGKHHAANASGKRAYPDRPVIVETMSYLGAVAACTSRLRLGTAVLVAPYRHPLVAAQQLGAIDRISGGRLTVGVGPGWLRGEFDALGIDFDRRGEITMECIEVYRKAWTREWLEHRGEHFQFEDVSMDPKPLQSPHPPILYGGTTPAGARRAGQACDGLIPTLLHWDSRPDMYDDIVRAALEHGEAAGRDMSDFALVALAAGRLTERPLPERGSAGCRQLLTGSAEQMLTDLASLYEHGYSHCALYLDIPSGTIAEYKEQIEAIGESVIPHATF